MTLAFAIASVVAGAALAVAGVACWRNDDEPGLALLLGLPGGAFIYAGADFIIRTVA